ncbi:APC family permease [Aeromicrobium fastidiosum]|uniref:APC family permease n=1 Tax=Aeromicrobium fastidiosum TaxID=52699 RepID=A0A641AST0_9ACTN|nr:APC family permease [Aeromicrobium fastidiosum]KAA1380587.1 APC family permease [Aeromicrobium fastidiosum]MBP2390185.1 amino acid transporter [Aeromicrobium fastidiosum]
MTEATSPAVEKHQTRLKPNSLGVFGILFFVLSSQAPLTGIAGAVPIAIVIGNGAGVPTAYIAAGLIIFVFSIGFVAMGRHVVHAGAFYAYIGKGLGETTGVSGAFVALFAYNTIQAAMYGLYGVIMQGIFVHHFSFDLPWWVWALATMAVVQLLGAMGVDIGARVLAVLVAAEFSLLSLFAVVTLFKGGGPEGFGIADTFSLSAATAGAPGVALMFAIASMFGFEATAIYGEEAREPRKTVPRATYLSVLIITGFFAFVTWMLVAFYGPSQVVGEAGKALDSGDGATFVFAAVGSQLGGWTGDVLEVLLATSLFAGILAFHNSITRYLFSLSRDRVIPASVSLLNKRHSPWVAGAVQTVLVVVLTMPFAILGKDPVLTLFSWFSGVAVLGMMLLYFMTSVSVVAFFRRTPSESSLATTLVAPLVGSVGIGIAVWLILANFKTLIGGSGTTAFWLIVTVPAIAVVGALVGHLRRGVIREELID